MTKTEITTIPVPLIGSASTSNKGTLKWSYEKLICLANGVELFVVDSKTLEVVRVLSGHTVPVTHVLWLPSGRQFVSAESKLSPRDILSADANHQIIVWDALKGQQVGNFAHPDGSRSILDIQIPQGTDLWTRTKVYILFSGNLVVVYDYVHGSSDFISIVNPVGDNTGITEMYVKFACDPYNANQHGNVLAFLGMDSSTGSLSSVAVCTFWDCAKDMKISLHTRIPLDGKANSSGTGNNPSTMMSRSISVGGISSLNALDPSKRPLPSSSSIRKLVSDIIVGQDYGTGSTGSPNPNSNGSLMFHPGIKDSIVVYTENVVYLISVRFAIVLHTFSLDKQTASIVQVTPTTSRPCLYTVHDNGTIVLRKYSITGIHSLCFQLDTVCYSDNPRFAGKKVEVIGSVVHPADENVIIMYLNDGRLLKYALTSSGMELGQWDLKPHVTTPATPHTPCLAAEASEATTQPCKHGLRSKHVPKLNNIVKSILNDNGIQVDLSIQLKQVTHAFGQFTCINSRRNLLIAGTTAGFVVVLHIVDDRLKALKKFTVHSSSPVSGIEFISDTEILTYSNLSFSTIPKCELVLTEIWTGASRCLKTDENQHIQTLKVSPLCQYFVLAYKGGSRPCELWDLPRRQLIKNLPNRLPAITCIHWRQLGENIKEEVFYMTDLGTFLFTFRVEGNRFLNATCVKLEHTAHVAGVPTALFSKDEMVFRADSNAVLVMYNTSKKTASPSSSIGRGPLLTISKVPDVDQFIIQLADSLILWDFSGPNPKKIKSLHSGLLKTSSISILQNWVAYVPIGSNDIRLLSLGITNGESNPPIISHLKFPYFMDGTEKASKILQICSDTRSNVTDLVHLAQDFGSPEECKLWHILNLRWNDNRNWSGVDLFSDRQSFKEILVKTVQSVWALDYRKREEVAKILLWTGDAEKAAEILLDTEPSDSTSYVLNGLKASIAVGSQTLPEQSKAVMKIIATNLIACGDMDGGLELLCLLQKYSEACKYVESINDWSKGILLCKTVLEDKSAEDTLCKYAQFLNSKKCAYKASTVYLYCEKYDRALEVLFGARLRHLSYLLLHFCLRKGIQLSISDHIQTAINLDFARFLFECGLQKESIKFCEDLGEKGNDLKQELEILAS